jgi:hypothetical protein
MPVGENSMTGKEKAGALRPKQGEDKASGGLADSSLNESPAVPGGPPSDDEGHHKIPGNDQLEGLEKAEKAGRSPAKP